MMACTDAAEDRRPFPAPGHATWRRGTSESVFIEWDRNLIWLATHEGVDCPSTPTLGKPVLQLKKVAQWMAPHLNAGWDA
jgi:hypothetical protein